MDEKKLHATELSDNELAKVQGGGKPAFYPDLKAVDGCYYQYIGSGQEGADNRYLCPICGRPTQQRVLPTTRLTEFPLFCKHCRLTTVAEYAPEPLSQSH